MSVTVDNVLQALSRVLDPDLKKDLVSLGMIRDIEVSDLKVSFSVVLTTPACPLKESIKSSCIQAIHDWVHPDAEVQVNLTARVTTVNRSDGSSLKTVKNIIAVASGKGGVGKTTVAANIALSLAKSGARTALVDADIYGPSLPLMFGLVNEPIRAIQANGQTKAIPLRKHGVDLLSIGFFVDASKALIWRGPLASSALKQLFFDTQWGEIDYMVVDLPPGTGDIHLSLVQNVPLTGAVIVTTPHELAIADATKAVNMFNNENIHVPILGVVENMSWFTPAELPNNRYYIFGDGGGVKMANDLKLSFLGQLPLIAPNNQSGIHVDNDMLSASQQLQPYFDGIVANLVRQVSISNAQKQELKTALQ